MTRALFVCSRNRLRSPTAEEVFSGYAELECASAGTEADAELPLDADLVAWADVILVMERIHKTRITERFAPLLKRKRIVVLGIPDQYRYMEPALVQLLQRKVAPLLRLPRLG